MRTTMSIREIRKVLFDTDNTVIINSVEMSNAKARGFLYIFENQDKLVKVITIDSCMQIWLVD